MDHSRKIHLESRYTISLNLLEEWYLYSGQFEDLYDDEEEDWEEFDDDED